MKKSTKLRYTPPERLSRDACLVQIYPTQTGVGKCFILRDAALVIGREPDCDVHVGDPSISRRHARLEPHDDAHAVVDLRSTNGTYVNEVRVTTQQLRDGDYLQCGNAVFRYLAGGNVEVAYHEEIYRLTISDPLTGVHNKRYLLEYLEHELSRAARYGRPLALIMFDVDRFKGVNDSRGHLCGDYVLRELTACVKEAVRKEDLVARYGGEEFVVVMPETPVKKAAVLAERLRKLVEAHPFRFDDQPFNVTISLGVADVEGAAELTVPELIRRADVKLYQAKQEGRNRVVS